jgi:peptidoglycan/xylan/chitin deacetylase (PgdA/CDA1 family)
MNLVKGIADQAGIRQPPSSVLDWPALRALAADGVELAPHSREHPLLDRVEAARLEEELRGSMHDLQQEIGETLPVLAYPSGAHSGDVRAAAERCGFRVGFTTQRGVNDLDACDWLMCRRINVGRNSSVNVIRAQIGRWALLWSR